MKPLFMRSLLAGLSLGFCLATSVAQARYETCYEQEYVCHTEYQQECNYENRCDTVPGDRQCRQVRLCTPRPSQPNCQMVTECGTNALGQQICKERKVCNGSTGGGEDCGYVEQCENTPSHTQCHQERVCEQVPRQSCHYEQVAKQCYVPDPEPIPAPTPTPPPPPYHPPTPDPEPIPWPTPTPEPDPVPPTPIDPGPIDPGPITPAPQPEPIPAPGENGEKSVIGVQLAITKNKVATLTFKDHGQSLTYKTRYFISVFDRNSNLLVNQFASADGKLLQKIVLQNELSRSEEYTLVLKVVRTGGELVQDVKFEKTVYIPHN